MMERKDRVRSAWREYMKDCARRGTDGLTYGQWYRGYLVWEQVTGS